MVAGITYNFLPFMTLPIYVALEKIDIRLVEAAKDLYAGPWRPGGGIVGAVVGGGLAAVLGVIFEWNPLIMGVMGAARRRVHRLVPGVRVVRPGHLPAVAARACSPGRC